MKWCIVYLGPPKNWLIHNTQTRRINALRASLQIARKCFPSTDIYVFHEDYTEEEFAACPEVTKFLEVDFKTGSEYYVPHSCSKGYLMMCRFFCGILQQHPILEQYTHYMRLDDDSYFMDIYPTEQHIQSLADTDYVYRSLFRDRRNHHFLYKFTLQYLRSIGFGEYIPHLERLLIEKTFLDGDGNYTGLAPYNNFHLASMRLWKHPVVTNYINLLESEHKILREGWLDANVHAMIIFVIAPFIGMKVAHDGAFGYRHNHTVSPINTVGITWNEALPFYPNLPNFSPI